MTPFHSLNLQEVHSWKDLYKPLKNLCQINKQEAGVSFEQFCKAYYLFEPTVKDEYKNVWQGLEAPLPILRQLNLGIAEHGRDLILEDKEGLFSLVQCKFKTDQDEILSWSKDKIANLFAEGDKSDFVVVFTNASGLDHYSREKKALQLKLVTLGDLVQILPETLRQMVSFLQGHPGAKQAVHFTPRPDQSLAVEKVLEGYKRADRGQLILPCGSGKTLTSLWIKEAMNPNHTLVILPSLALLRQFKNEWARNQKEWLPYLCVCSEKDIDKSEDAAEVHPYEIGGRVTTNPDEIKAFLVQHSRTIIYATYQSLEAIQKAIHKTPFKFALAICDEAHKTAGAHSTEFAKIHKDSNVPVQKRLYMTATPRIRSRNLKVKDDEEELIADMSSQEIYGPIFYRMSFKEAIDLGILVDYKIIAIGVSDAEIQKAIHDRHFADHKGETVEDYANNFALQKLMQKYPASHTITFHSTVKRAELFKERHQELDPGVLSDHVSGRQTTNTRNLIMDAFKNAQKGVVTNARCLTEGIDVPTIDAVYFCDPKNSVIDIVQASGRALRKAKHKDKPLGYIVVPIYHKDEELLESSIQTGPYKKLVDIVRALCDQDERLQAEINKIKFSKEQNAIAGSSHISIDVDDTVRIVLEDFSERLKKVLFDQIIEKSFHIWDYNYELIKRFRQQYPDKWPSQRERYQGRMLGSWCQVQRMLNSNGQLSADRKSSLEELRFPWDPFYEAWVRSYRLLYTWSQEYPGKWPVRTDIYKGFRIGFWCDRQRQLFRSGLLPADRKALLDRIQYPWVQGDFWQSAYGVLLEYRKSFPNKWPQSGDNFNGVKIGDWVRNQRVLLRKNGMEKNRADLLEAIHFPWLREWEEKYQLLLEYVRENGNKMPKSEEIYRGIALGNWCTNQRTRRSFLSKDRIKLLDQVGFNWVPYESKWESSYAALLKFRRLYPERWPRIAEIFEGAKIGVWCSIQRLANKNKSLRQERKALLDKIGFAWEVVINKWQTSFELLVKYRTQFPQRWPTTTEVYEGHKIGQWCVTQRYVHKKMKLPAQRLAYLEQIGFPLNLK